MALRIFTHGAQLIWHCSTRKDAFGDLDLKALPFAIKGTIDWSSEEVLTKSYQAKLIVLRKFGI